MDYSPLTDAIINPLLWVIGAAVLVIIYGIALLIKNTPKEDRALYLELLRTYARELTSIFRRK